MCFNLRIVIAFLAYTAILCVGNVNAQEVQNTKTLIVIFDGLRSDYVTSEIMPNTFKLIKKGCVSSNHHSVFPTVTRVNSAAMSTGAYPAVNGLMGNSVFFPEVDPVKGISTDDAHALLQIQKVTGGKLYTSVTLSELLQKNGKNLMIFSTGSTGQSYLLNPNATLSSPVINPNFIQPTSFSDTLFKAIGPIPEVDGKKNGPRHQWITNAYMHFGMAKNGPEVSIIWFSDPDGTAHAKGVGSPETIASITFADSQLGRILDEITKKGLESQVNIMISTDHGFVTHTGKNNLVNILIEKGYKKDKLSDDVVVVGGAVYIKNRDIATIGNIVTLLQQQDWVGAIFTDCSSKNKKLGHVPGTLSFNAIHFDHSERKPDILFDYAWDSLKNEFGYPGRSTSYGVAGHGCSSPFEISTLLIAAGPDFKSNGFKSEFPTSLVDIMPTILKLQDIEVPKQVEGRVMTELFISSSEKSKKEDYLIHADTNYSNGKYKLHASFTSFKDKIYLNYTKTTREK
ncbi:MAG: alkaline phosphatase family protein [Bacteroidales bacterium]|nr:alkaline phosphatase family protein [Bacteroidales bacterium]